MGFDPMTHQPRTDFFSSLPHLIALANLRDLMEHRPIEEHAMRLQEDAVQLAKLQYLQYLLQSAATIHNPNSYGQNGVTDMEALNLLNSIPPTKENLLLNSSELENQASYHFANATSQLLHHPSVLSPLSDPQVPFSYQPSLNTEMGQAPFLTTMLSQEGNNPSDSSWVLPSPSPVLATATETNISNPGDASSTTSCYGGGTSSYWPELFFEDSIMHDIS
ncbi:hypothetical protein SADUNF_Sadunf05G0117700 [Salix dunnii]|uniref:MYB transcription factor n=1 Tax=Salix dunnii TaxID=1413687 RepID=A0A835N3N1_9ROSI|nr:hypothetical protein SADUNF_Sadunf05G0117700 [Salix dunnii]